MAGQIVTIQRPFHANVRPGIIRSRDALRNALPPESPWMLIQAACEWCKMQGPRGHRAASVIAELYHRNAAIRQMCETRFPDGELKELLRRCLDGKMTVIPM